MVWGRPANRQKQPAKVQTVLHIVQFLSIFFVHLVQFPINHAGFASQNDEKHKKQEKALSFPGFYAIMVTEKDFIVFYIRR
nr:hypothetical protein [uncultured Agathobaculum sp.]